MTKQQSTSTPPPDPAISRVIAYVDGFNLYYGLKSKGWKRYYWLNVQAMLNKLLTRGQRLTRTKYFTSRVSGTETDPGKPKRQSTYLEALQLLPALDIFFGHYLSKPVRCSNCKNTWQKNEEKMTDVNIATEILVDAFDNQFDTAVLVTADSDLTRPIETIRQRFPSKRVVLAFPPNRFSDRLRRTGSAHMTIGRGVIAASQFPDQVVKPNGFILHRPSEWQ